MSSWLHRAPSPQILSRSLLITSTHSLHYRRDGKMEPATGRFLEQGSWLRLSRSTFPFHRCGNCGREKVRLVTSWHECPKGVLAPLSEGHGEAPMRRRLRENGAVRNDIYSHPAWSTAFGAPQLSSSPALSH